MAGRFGSWSNPRRSVQGQGGMRAQYSGVIPLVRHSVDTRFYVEGSNSGTSPTTIGSGKALAFPLVVYQGTTGGSGGESSAPVTREGSRVNNVGCNLQIVQSDTSKPNQVYVGFISVSFNEAGLNSTLMESQFADLIEMHDTDNGYLSYNIATGLQQKDLDYATWQKNALMRHWIRGFSRNSFTLYSGRPAVQNITVPVPRKNKRQQFGSGYYMVIMNDSDNVQSDTSSATDINVSLETFFKEIPEPDVTVT
mgnify:CR=1 FL=1|tara:strand:- start:1477 stop:2232 length:756 start_codon:yes stop_codon:yes gene_type:complete